MGASSCLELWGELLGEGSGNESPKEVPNDDGSGGFFVLGPRRLWRARVRGRTDLRECAQSPRCPCACCRAVGHACRLKLFGEVLGQTTGDKAAEKKKKKKTHPQQPGRGHGHSASGARRCIQNARLPG